MRSLSGGESEIRGLTLPRGHTLAQELPWEGC